MSKYVLSLASQNSLQDIYSYSIKHFGKRKAKEYLRTIQNKLNDLATTPLLGNQRHEIKAGYYSYLVGSHTIYYRIQPNQIEIIDVLHQSMEPTFHML